MNKVVERPKNRFYMVHNDNRRRELLNIRLTQEEKQALLACVTKGSVSDYVRKLICNEIKKGDDEC